MIIPTRMLYGVFIASRENVENMISISMYILIKCGIKSDRCYIEIIMFPR